MSLLLTTTKGARFDWMNPNPTALGWRAYAVATITDDGRDVALPGDYGTVEYINEDGVPTVRFERTGRASIVGVMPPAAGEDGWVYVY